MLMLMLRKNWISHFLIISTLVVLMILAVVNKGKRKIDIQVIALFVFNGVVWFYLLIKEIRRRAYSLKIMNWFFCFFFFSLAPVVQYYADYFPWIKDRTDIILYRANKLLLLWTISVVVGIRLGNRRQTFKRKKNGLSSQIKKMIGWEGYVKTLPFLTIINLLNTFSRILLVGTSNLLSRGTNTGIVYSSYRPLSVLIAQFITGIVYFTVAISILQYKYNNKNTINSFIFLCINFICLLISYFPTGLGRYAAAVIYLGLMITYFKSLKKNRFFILIFIMAFMIILPFFNAFRSEKFFEVNILNAFKDTISNIVSGLKAVDYDAYTYFTLTIEYVDRHGAGGNHLLSDILFWVPRKLWPSKALSGSYEIAHELGLFDNVSFPYPAIGYIDGGNIGMVLFGIFIGWVMELVDGYYWNYIDLSNKVVHEFDIMYPVVVVFWLFLYRGDIFYTLNYLVGYILAWRFIVWFTKKNKINLRK